jgi:hypothetical protein
MSDSVPHVLTRVKLKNYLEKDSNEGRTAFMMNPIMIQCRNLAMCRGTLAPGVDHVVSSVRI